MPLRFTLATDAMKPQIGELWKLCFGDPDDYIGFYLARGFVAEQTLTAFEGDVMVAMLTMIPFEVPRPERMLRGRYVFAVATHPGHQKRGYSTSLLLEAHRRMEGEGVDLSVLVPASESLFDFYGKRGYRTDFHLAFREWSCEDPAVGGAVIPLAPRPLQSLGPVRDAAFGDSALYCAYGADTLRFLGEECGYHGGEVLTFTHDGRPGYAVCYPFGDKLFVKECAPNTAAEAILPALHARYGKGSYQLRLRADAGGGRPFAMSYWYKEPVDLTAGAPPYIALVLD